MTPKEEAKKLIDKFKSYVSSETTSKHHDENRQLSNAKECALICVEEIINHDPINPFNCLEDAEKFWREVKKEIENYGS